MSLGRGPQLGPYEIVAELGAGGMGQVFRARDTRLGREVALKVLPEELAGSAERRTRFEHEARLLASLNHPGIASLHDVLDYEGSPVLVMEVVEGETLAERVARGPIPAKQALEIAVSIAEALEAAHERGILHRDLKPSNVKLTPRGDVKVLDFGLAKVLELDGGDLASAAATLPKLVEKTGSGIAVGTAPYMSPEQARGEPVDKRTDVWAFGCVLFEMLTGRRAFSGATRADAIAAVLGSDPDWGRLPSTTSDAVRRVLKRCLQKKQKERLRDIADVKLELKEALVDRRGASPQRRWSPIPVAIGALGIIVAIGALMTLRRPPPPLEVRKPRAQLTLPRGVRLSTSAHTTDSTLAISPDGRRVAFLGCSSGCRIYLRDRLELDAKPLDGTEGGSTPFFSPDGRFLGFGAQGKLKKIDLERGVILNLADARELRGASWGEDDIVYFSDGASGLRRVPADGGAVEEVTRLDAGEHDHRWPQILPGGKAVLFEIAQEEATRSDGSPGHDVAILDLTNGARRTLVERAGCPKYVDGHVLFGRDGTIYAMPLDPDHLEPSLPPRPVLEDVAMWSTPSIRGQSSGVVSYDVARDGTLLYSPRDSGLPRNLLVALDREGRRTVLSSAERAYDSPRISPDGRRIAVTVRTDLDASDVFILELSSGAWTKLNVAQSPLLAAAWMPDGDHVLVAPLERDRGALVVGVGDREPAMTIPFDISSRATVTPDGSAILSNIQGPRLDWDIWRIELEGASEPWLVTEAQEEDPSFSPDGRWVAYSSRDSGRREIYVRAYAASTARSQVSTEGGQIPRWSMSGEEIFFLRGPSSWSARVRTSPGFDSEAPRKLFDWAEDILCCEYDVFPDGQKFVMVQADPLELRPPDLVVIPGWAEEMKARLTER